MRNSWGKLGVAGIWRLGVCLMLFFSTAPVLAQSAPADLLDLSIEELFKIEVSDGSPTDAEQPKRWHLYLKYQQSEFEEYFEGHRKLSFDEVLFSPGIDQRSNDNFPVIPTEISQEVYAIIIGYDLSDRATLSVVFPFVKQTTDHISIVPGYSDFRIKSDGIGDISVVGNYRFSTEPEKDFRINVGLSLPTGSIDQLGDTPRAPGNQQLPYSMQLGSGTYDISAYISYIHRAARISWGGEIGGKLRLGENDRSYHLGHRLRASTWLRYNSLDWVQPSIRISYQYWDRIHGADSELSVPGAFPYPAPVTNPDLFGGNQADVILGFRFPFASSSRFIELEAGKPFYRSLNGPQAGEHFHFSVTLGTDF